MSDFSPAPTAAREYVRIAVMLFVNDSPYVFKTADVSRAFTQSDYYHKKDRAWVELPKFGCPASPQRKGELFLDSNRTIVEDAEVFQFQRSPPDNTRYAVQLFKPLYDTWDAPMRWYCRLAEIFISHSFFPLKNDRCVFSRFRALREGEAGYTPNAVLTNTCIVVVHVDDIIFPGIRADWEDLKTAMSELKHGEWEELSQSIDITFCGIVISLKQDRIVEMTQQPYYKKIRPLILSEFIQKVSMILPSREVQRELKAFLGACLWLSQARFDIGFALSLMGSIIPESILSVKSLQIFIRTAGKLPDRISDQHVPLRYVPFSRSSSGKRFIQVFSVQRRFV